MKAWRKIQASVLLILMIPALIVGWIFFQIDQAFGGEA